MNKVVLVWRTPDNGRSKYLCAAFHHMDNAVNYTGRQVALMLQGKTFYDPELAHATVLRLESQFEFQEIVLEDEMYADIKIQTDAGHK